MESRLSIFLAELRRRKVTRVAVAYSVVGFVVWQIAEIAFPALDLPDTALTLVVVLTGLGFPIALVLSWAYEIRPEEPRTPDSDSERGAGQATGPNRRIPNELLGPSATSAFGRVGAGPARPWESGAPLSSFRAVSASGGNGGDATYRLLVVDDDADTRRFHAEIARGLGHEVETASDGLEAMAKLPLDIDLVMLDANMPNMDGFEVARRIRSDPGYAHLPIVMVTGLGERADRIRAVEVGINDFIVKPVDEHEFKLRADWLLELKTAYDRLGSRHAELERVVESRTAALRSALEEMTDARRLTHEIHLDTIHRLTLAAELVDREAPGHVERVGMYAQVVATELRQDADFVERIRHAAPMHDVGKIGIPRDVLMKPGALDDEEWALVRSHTTLGARILTASPSPVIQMGERIARSHHEWWDGGGYPSGLAGEAIPLEGRICAVADFFDSLTLDRPHRAALPQDEVVEMMRDASATQFDPDVLNAFLSSLPAIEKIRAEVR